MRVLSRAVGALALAAVALSAAPAVAVVGGVHDGNAHPNVGMVLGLDTARLDYPVLVCTGTLVAPDVVLTAAHCAQTQIGTYHLRYVVTFNTQVVLDDTAFPVNPADGIDVAQVIPDPAYDNTLESNAGIGQTAFDENVARDIGVLRLSRDASTGFPGITPAPIIAADGLAAYEHGPKPDLGQVGYGDTRVGPPGQGSSYAMDGFRNRALFPLKKLTPGLVWGNANPNDANGFGLPASGDSGSPYLLGDEVAGVHSGGGNRNSVVGPRLDTGPGRAFLATQGLVP